MSDFKIHKNDRNGVQVEWRGILLTLRLNNKHHGISGSIVGPDREDGQPVLLNFHGFSPSKPLPLAFHEETLEEES